MLADAPMARVEPLFTKFHDKPGINYKRVLSWIIFIDRNFLRWLDAPKEDDPYKTFYSGRKHGSDKEVFVRMIVGLAADHN